MVRVLHRLTLGEALAALVAAIVVAAAGTTLGVVAADLSGGDGGAHGPLRVGRVPDDTGFIDRRRQLSHLPRR